MAPTQGHLSKFADGSSGHGSVVDHAIRIDFDNELW